MSTENAVAIVGAGPAGLAMGRALQALEIPFQIFERHSDVGGIWDCDNAGSPMYDSAHFISSKKMSGHYGFPMPDDFPDYPSNRQILQYIRSFAQTFNLYDHIQFQTQVIQSELVNGVWEVTIADKSGAKSQQKFGWLVCANGTNWFPNQPDIQGQENFQGDLFHSVHYRNAESLKGKKVLVIGAGNSGVDIACDAAFAADQAYISLRRGYHFVPKHVFGVPADEFGSRSDWVPMPIQQLTFGIMLKILNGDLTRLGLPEPDHKIFSSHPILNTQLLHYLQHGDIHAKPDIEFLSENSVHFVDGSRIEVDTIIQATGYQWHIPYLNNQYFKWTHNRPNTFLKIFNPEIPNLFINGFIETNGGAYKLFDNMAYLIAKTIEAQIKQPESAEQIQCYINRTQVDLSGNVAYIPSERHHGYTNTQAYRKAMKQMRKSMGWPDLSESFYEQNKLVISDSASAEVSM